MTPIERAAAWLDEARRHASSGSGNGNGNGIAGEPDAMALATVGADGAPSVRLVLCRFIDARGFRFY
ncbi:MAG TPA: pyridoxamine 5'-phosphate oxidase family protein, partial [Polyangiaceae bacterium]